MITRSARQEAECNPLLTGTTRSEQKAQGQAQQRAFRKDDTVSKTTTYQAAHSQCLPPERLHLVRSEYPITLCGERIRRVLPYLKPTLRLLCDDKADWCRACVRKVR